MHRLLIHLNNISQVYYRQERYKDALSNYEKSLAKNRKIFGTDEHASIVSTLNNIAQVYDRQGRYKDALSNYEKSLAINRRIFESD